MANDSRSGTVAARRRALERVQKRTRDREEKTGDAIVAAEGALEDRRAAQVAERAADDRWRVEVQKLVDLSWSLEEIAELVGVDVSEVRRARLQRAVAVEVVEEVSVPAGVLDTIERNTANPGGRRSRPPRGGSGAGGDAASDPAAGGTSGVGQPVGESEGVSVPEEDGVGQSEG